jgi:hypothetical protein
MAAVSSISRSTRGESLPDRFKNITFVVSGIRVRGPLPLALLLS